MVLRFMAGSRSRWRSRATPNSGALGTRHVWTKIEKARRNLTDFWHKIEGRFTIRKYDTKRIAVHILRKIAPVEGRFGFRHLVEIAVYPRCLELDDQPMCDWLPTGGLTPGVRGLSPGGEKNGLGSTAVLVNNDSTHLAVETGQEEELPGVVSPGFRKFDHVRRLTFGDVVAVRVSEQ